MTTTTHTTVQGAEPAAQDRYLCQAWGETDLPVAAIVGGLEAVRAFLVAYWLGDADHEGYDGSKTLPAVMQQMQEDSALEGEAWKWSAEFEIGGISVQKVFHAAAPQAPTAPLDLSAFEKARFGVFNPDGRFEEIPEGVSPCGWAEAHPCGHTARWVGGPRDAELLRAVLASAGHGRMQFMPDGGPAGSGGWESHAQAMERERDFYRQRAQTMHEHQVGDVWYWQGDGEDHLKSMANSLPVVIRADQLRALLASAGGA